MKFDIRNAPLSKFNDTVLSVLDMHFPKYTWKTVGSHFLEKAFHKESIILNNNNKSISSNEEIVEIFNKTLL